MRWPLLPLVALAGCPWIGAGELDERLDADGDGYPAVAVGGSDCDDDDPTIHPDAIERCDGIDDDCDGAIDEGRDEQVAGGERFTIDDDDDGFGAVDGATTIACSAPEGYAANDEDCDDGAASVRPGSDERCNGIDDDCDGDVDEDPIDGEVRYLDTDGDTFGDPATGAAVCDPEGTVGNGLDCDDSDPTRNPDTSWYADADADGYGDPERFVRSSCAAPADAASNDDDCDDTDPALNPDTPWYSDDDGDGFGAALVAVQCETPAEGLRTGGDCDDADPRVNPATEWFEDADGDGYPGTVLSAASCVAPAGGTLDPTDCDDSNPAVSPDGVELCSTVGVDDDCDGSVDAADRDTPPPDAESWYFDFDRDGWGVDPAVPFCGAPTSTQWSEQSGDCDDYQSTQNPDTVWIEDEDRDGFWSGDGPTVAQCDKPSDDHLERVLVLAEPDEQDCNDDDDTIYPGADEFCDAIDSDCDGELNDDDSTGEQIWWRDDDDDGFGDDNFDTFACFQPEGYTDNPDDCDDNLGEVYPGAPDPCYDGDDLNCDGDDEDDCDGDGFLPFFDGGEDCDDLDPFVNPDLPTTRTVPGDHPTIQEALDAACIDDTILVGSGTFSGPFIAARPVHLIGEGVASSVLTGNGTDRVLEWVGGSVQHVQLEGGFADDGACFYQDADAFVRLEDLELRDCHATFTGGGMVLQGHDFEVQSVAVFDSSANNGGGIYTTFGSGSLTDVSCTGCSGLSGGAVSMVFATVDIEGLTLDRPTAASSVFLGANVGGTWRNLTFLQPESQFAGLLLTAPGSSEPLIIEGLHIDRPATTSAGNVGVWGSVIQDLVLRDVVVSEGDIDAPYVGAFVLDLNTGTNGQVEVSGVEVRDVGAATRIVTTAGGTALLEHGTFVETEGGLILDAGDPGSITLRNTVVAYDSERGLTIEGELPDIEGSVLYGNLGGDWPYGTPYLGFDGNDSVPPGFLTWGPSLVPASWDLRLGPDSPLRDAGMGLDADGTPADIGAYGGDVDPDALLDADGDELYDSWELRFGLDPTSDSQAGDPDGDGLDNRGEANAGSWPDTADTDGDGLDDGTEVLAGSSPVDAADP